MRRYGWLLVATAVAAAVGGTAALAEMDINGPADVPPGSYKGRQYVDSAGCVFVRAGYGGTVNWVPRVDRAKKQLCGYKPTFQNGEPVLDVAKVAPLPAAPVTVPAAPSVAASRPVAPVSATPVRVTQDPAPAPVLPRRSGSPFEPTPFVGKPMETIATTETPPRIGLGARATTPAIPKAAPVRAAEAAPVAPVAPVPSYGPALSRAGYVSPYAMNGGTVEPAPLATAVRYHNTLPLPGAVQIVATQTVDAASTACPIGTGMAQRYTLSDGRRVVRCGAPTENPAAFINAAAVPGLIVTSAPMVGGAGYGPQAADVRGYPVVTTAPLVGGAGYGARSSAQTYLAPGAGGVTPQQAYAASSPYAMPGAAAAPMIPAKGRVSSSSYGSVPAAVFVRSPAGQTTLAPVGVATNVGPTGYAPAFDDGRLNPFRGPRTAMGDAEQGLIWTNEVPARRVTDKTPARKRIVPDVPAYGMTPAYATPYAAAPVIGRVSSKSAPVSAPQMAGPRYVQVGTFAVPANAAAAKARLAAAGLPVSASTNGHGMTAVLAGPFADARQALAAVRSAGFADTLLR